MSLVYMLVVGSAIQHHYHPVPSMASWHSSLATHSPRIVRWEHDAVSRTTGVRRSGAGWYQRPRFRVNATGRVVVEPPATCLIGHVAGGGNGRPPPCRALGVKSDRHASWRAGALAVTSWAFGNPGFASRAPSEKMRKSSPTREVERGKLISPDRASRRRGVGGVGPADPMVDIKKHSAMENQNICFIFLDYQPP